MPVQTSYNYVFISTAQSSKLQFNNTSSYLSQVRNCRNLEINSLQSMKFSLISLIFKANEENKTDYANWSLNRQFFLQTKLTSKLYDFRKITASCQIQINGLISIKDQNYFIYQFTLNVTLFIFELKSSPLLIILRINEQLNINSSLE